jgi:hypothetical protein
MSRCQDTEEVPAKGLNRTLCSVSSFLVGGNRLVRDVLGIEVGEERLRSFVVQNLDL